MKRYIRRIGQLALLMGFATSCYVEPSTVTPSAPVVAPTAGTANFTKYVAVGNSLTAGYADGGVYRAGQLAAYPNLLAQQFKLVGGGDFLQPLYSEAQKDGTGYLVLRNNPVIASPIIQPFGPGSTGFMGGIRQTTPNVLYTKYTEANNNFGVPGIRIDNVNIPGYGALNPHFERLLADADVTTKTYRQHVLDKATGATFFSMWLGNNDALGYALSGATGATPFSNTLTSLATFQASYDAMLNTMMDPTPNGLGISKGVLMTIPNVTLIPHCRAITYASLLARIRQTAPTINDIFIETATGTRPATANDLFLLGAQADYGNFGSTTVGAGVPFPYGLHPFNPLKSSSVLDSDEVTVVNTRIAEFNAHITAKATEKNLALFNANALMTTASTTGYLSNNLLYRVDFISGGVFGLDGVHLTPAGNAIIANETMRAINAKYGSTLPLLNTSLYKTVQITPAP